MSVYSNSNEEMNAAFCFASQLAINRWLSTDWNELSQRIKGKEIGF